MRIFFFRVVLAPLLVLILNLYTFVHPGSGAPVETGDILVADPASGTIRHYSAAGVDRGAFAAGLSSPWSITVDRFGNIYVSELLGPRVTKFFPTGAISWTITTPYNPGGIRVSAGDGTIFVTDYSGGGVYRYNSDSGAALDPGPFVSTSLSPADFIAFDADGNLYVTGTDVVIDVVRQFSPSGEALGDFVSNFPGAAGIAFDANGNLYVSSFNNSIVEKFSSSRDDDLGIFASTALTAPSLMGIAFDASGNLYVANSGEGDKVLRSSPTGPDLVGFASAGLGGPRDLVVIPPAVVPTVKEECKTDGWQSFDIFKNQGDCIQYINTGK